MAADGQLEPDRGSGTSREVSGWVGGGGGEGEKEGGIPIGLMNPKKESLVF